MEENTRFSVVVTVTGAILATLLVGIILFTVFQAAEIRVLNPADGAETTIAQAPETDESAGGDQASADAPAAEEAPAADAGESTNGETTAETATDAGGDNTEGEDQPAAEAQEPAAETDTTAEESPADGGLSAAAKTAFAKGACGSCHIIPEVPNAVGMVGPDLSDIGAVAATRIDGYTVEEYLYESIMEPDAYIAPDCPTGPCPAGVMLKTFSNTLSPEEIDLMVDYLATLGG